MRMWLGYFARPNCSDSHLVLTERTLSAEESLRKLLIDLDGPLAESWKTVVVVYAQVHLVHAQLRIRLAELMVKWS